MPPFPTPTPPGRLRPGRARIAAAIGIVALLVPLGATAQDSPGLVLMAPPEVRAEWTAALQVELAAEGTTVIPLDPPVGETVLIRDAVSQRMARTRGASAAVWATPSDRGYALRLVGADAERARVAPVAREADPRTVALIVVSLLEDPGALAPYPDGDPVETPAVDRARPLAADFGPEVPDRAPDALADPRSTPVAPWPRASPEALPPAPRRDGVRWSGVIGSGGYALVNDRHLVPGWMLRGGVRLRVGFLEAMAVAEVGLMLDAVAGQGSEVQPMVRGCLEGGPRFPTGEIGFHFGLRLCGGYAELRGHDFGSSLARDRGGMVLGGGGYLAISFPVGDGVRLLLRGDVEGAVVVASPHSGEVLPTIAGILAFD